MSTSRQSISAVNVPRPSRMEKSNRFRLSLLVALTCLALILPTIALADGWMSYGQTVTGYIARNDYQDSWRFSATAGDTIAIQLQRTSGCVDAHFSVFNPSGSILGFNWEYLGQFRGCSVRDTFRVRGLKLNRSGTYTVRVSRFGGPSAGGEGGYRLTLTLQQAACKRLDAKLRPGVRAKNTLSGAINIRAQATTSGRKITELASGAVVDVLDGPVNANGYYWFKIRHGNTTGWAAESGNCKYWLEQTSASVSNQQTRNQVTNQQTRSQIANRTRYHPDSGIVVDGICTLEDAIIAANTDRATGGCRGGEGSDVINLYTNISLKRNLPRITSRIKITGRGAIISGESRYRLFEVAANGSLTLDRVTLRNGKTDRNGGAVLNNGTLTVNRSTLTSNRANKHGGAIFNSGYVAVYDSQFNNNGAGGSGGAIRNNGTLIVNLSRFSGNSADDRGGAILHEGEKITLGDNTSFSNNTPQNCVGVDCGDIPELDPDLPTLHINSTTKPFTLAQGDAVERFQLRLTEPHTLSFRITAFTYGMVPAMTIWRDAKEQYKAENTSRSYYAALENVKL
ncbi:MAG: SH3 domain-containing protein, partial [Chloroflexota bacterium]|nr:SH3 domain-containing protein [Chloroflexota bacterium]